MTGIREVATAPAPSGRQGLPSLWDRLLYVILQVAYFRFRYDIFISYRRHYKPYVTKLKQQLEHVGYRAFFDGEECPPGSALNKTLHGALRRSAALVLVGSQDVDSPYVTMEVTTFGTTGRSIIPIDVDGALAGCQIGVIHERDLVWINENGAAFAVGVPSPDVLAGIEANFSYLKRNLRQRIEGLLIAVAVVAIAAGSVWYARHNVDIARAQEQSASEKAQKATVAAADAEDKRVSATAAAVKATEAAATAEELKRDAIKLGALARRTAQEEQGQRAALLASAPGREHEALLAGVLAVGPGVIEGHVPPEAAMVGVTEAVAAAARSLPISAGWTYDARITDDGRQIVSLGADGIRWWETGTGRLLRHVRTGTERSRATFCGESGLVASPTSSPASKRDELRFWDIATGKLWNTIAAEEVRAATTCSRDRRWAVLTQGGQEHLWDLEATRDIGAFQDRLGSDATPQFSADATRLISGKGIFEIPSRRLVAPLRNPELLTGTAYRSESGFRIISFFGGDRFIAGASAMGNVVVWSAEDGTPLHSFEVTKPRIGLHYLGTVERVHNTIDAMTISPDGKRIAVADIDNRITVWRTAADVEQRPVSLNVMAMEDAPQRLKLPTDAFDKPDFGAVTDLRFFDDTTLVFITEAGRGYIYDLSETELRRRRSIQDPWFVTDISALKAGLKPAFRFDRHGRELVTFGCFAGVRRWSWARSGFAEGEKWSLQPLPLRDV